MRHLVLSLGLLLAATFGGLTPATVRAEDPSPEQLGEWVAGLNADQFLQRERAMDQLIDAGEPAIDPVTAAILEGNPEVTLRGVNILLKLAMSEDEALGDVAVDALDRISQSENAVASIQAREMLGELAVHRQERAISELERLGAVISRSQIQVGFQILNYIGSIEIGTNWTGEANDLRHLRWLTQTRMLTLNSLQVTDEHLPLIARMSDLQALQINRASITAEGFASLQDMRNLRQLEILYVPLGDESIDRILQMPNLQYVRLYGLGLSREGAERLRRNIRAVTVDIRRGAFLGVSCAGGEGGCTLTNVTADSAAAQAGLRLGDVITHIGGEAVGDFTGLTELVSQYAPGEKVTIDGLRSGEEFSVEVEFGEWEQ